MTKALAEMAVLGFLILGAGHYWAPRLVGRELHRLEAYTLGIALGIWTPIAVVSWAEGLGWQFLLVVVVATAGAGMGTVLAWTFDAVNGAGGIVEWWRGMKKAAGLKGGRNGSPTDDEPSGMGA